MIKYFQKLTKNLNYPLSLFINSDVYKKNFKTSENRL